MLYGEDTNRNGILDWNENDGDNTSPSDNSNGKLEPGFFNYVTIHSYELNSAEGNSSKINISQDTNRGKLMELLAEKLGQEKALQIMAPIRLRSFDSLIDFYYFIGMEYDDFIKIIDRLTTTDETEVVGRVNINTASEAVLLCLPQLEQKDVDTLIQTRSKADTETTTILWVTKVLDREKAQAIGRYITVQSFQYSADIVAVSADGRAFCRYYVVIDTADGSPKIVYKQSLQNSGWPLDASILESLREGKEIKS